MIDITPTINLEGFYMVKFNPNSRYAPTRSKNDYKPACITRYTGITKPQLPKLHVNWFNYGTAVVPPDAILVKAFESFNDISLVKDVKYPNLRACFMKDPIISCPILSGSVKSSGYESDIIIDLRTDYAQNRTTITLKPDGTYLIS